MEKNYGVMKDITLEWLSNYPSRRWGRVITVASIYGKEKGSNAGFTAAKAAQIAFMKSMAGVTKGITFNTICPGHIQVGKQFFDKPDIIGQPEDVANIVTFLCSEKARHINGACITVDGGESSSF
jgi:3-oxoacyl-[acyl-carrier protein] reductase